MAGPSTARFRPNGTIPGVIDESQYQRLIRSPDIRLSFASFDPQVAFPHVDATEHSSQPNDSVSTRPRRIVIETNCSTGQSRWRFVPNARLENGAQDEGDWPRVINICGQEVLCSQDQWDIYKLDPFYECRVYPHPEITTVTPSTPSPAPAAEPLGSKRNLGLTPTMEDIDPRPRKRRVEVHDSSDSVEEVDKMIVDGPSYANLRPQPPPTPQTPGTSRKQFRETVDKNRHYRREKIQQRYEKLDEQSGFRFARDSQSVPPDPKRKARDIGSLSPEEEEEEDESRGFTYEPSANAKRTRTVSPGAARRKVQAQHAKRLHKKLVKLEEAKRQRGEQQREQMFRNSLHHPEPEDIHMASQSQYFEVDSDESDSMPGSDDLPGERSSSPTYPEPDDDEAAHAAALEESRRKLAELERDRPIWDEAARRREAAERAEREAEAQRKREKERQQRFEEHQRQEADRFHRAQVEEEQRRREFEARQRRAADKRAREARWNTGPWTHDRAIERYRSLCDAFDKEKFTVENPVSFDVIPWPILAHPSRMSVEDITWAAVEKFFEISQARMAESQYKAFAMHSHRRFHPDRWRSRNILGSVADEAERACLEVAANTVAQALTPLWLKARSPETAASDKQGVRT